jgi:glucose dehydrogenase
MAGERPVGVTIVAVIAWIIGAIQIVGGILAIIAGGVIDAWVVLIIGILTIAVSLGLFRGNNTARIIMAVVFVLNLVVAVWAIIIGVDFWDQIIAAILAIVGLVFLFSAKANAFFTQ